MDVRVLILKTILNEDARTVSEELGAWKGTAMLIGEVWQYYDEIVDHPVPL